MDSKTLIKALKTAVREVIKEELTEILRDGLQSTINEMSQPKQTTKQTVRVAPRMVHETKGTQKKVEFSENKWASILNETQPISDHQPSGVSSFAQLMNESIDSEYETAFNMTSKNAQGFGMQRQMATSVPVAAPKTMHDPETGKDFAVDPIVAKAMTRDYSALMKAMNKPKGKI
jgi:hypothetical protein